MLTFLTPTNSTPITSPLESRSIATMVLPLCRFRVLFTLARLKRIYTELHEGSISTVCGGVARITRLLKSLMISSYNPTIAFFQFCNNCYLAARSGPGKLVNLAAVISISHKNLILMIPNDIFYLFRPNTALGKSPDRMLRKMESLNIFHIRLVTNTCEPRFF